MSSPLADLQDSVSALHVTLRHLCRALEGNLGTWPTGDRLVAASSLQRLLETDALFSLLQDRARGAIAAAREARDSGASGASGGEATTPVGAYKTLADVPAGVTPASYQSGAYGRRGSGGAASSYGGRGGSFRSAVSEDDRPAAPPGRRTSMASRKFSTASSRRFSTFSRQSSNASVDVVAQEVMQTEFSDMVDGRAAAARRQSRAAPRDSPPASDADDKPPEKPPMTEAARLALMSYAEEMQRDDDKRKSQIERKSQIGRASYVRSSSAARPSNARPRPSRLAPAASPKRDVSPEKPKKEEKKLAKHARAVSRTLRMAKLATSMKKSMAKTAQSATGTARRFSTKPGEGRASVTGGSPFSRRISSAQASSAATEPRRASRAANLDVMSEEHEEEEEKSSTPKLPERLRASVMEKASRPSTIAVAPEPSKRKESEASEASAVDRTAGGALAKKLGTGANGEDVSVAVVDAVNESAQTPGRVARLSEARRLQHGDGDGGGGPLKRMMSKGVMKVASPKVEPEPPEEPESPSDKSEDGGGSGAHGVSHDAYHEFMLDGSPTELLQHLLPALEHGLRETANLYVVFMVPVFLTFRMPTVLPWVVGVFNVLVELSCARDYYAHLLRRRRRFRLVVVLLLELEVRLRRVENDREERREDQIDVTVVDVLAADAPELDADGVHALDRRLQIRERADARDGRPRPVALSEALGAHGLGAAAEGAADLLDEAPEHDAGLEVLGQVHDDLLLESRVDPAREALALARVPVVAAHLLQRRLRPVPRHG